MPYRFLTHLLAISMVTVLAGWRDATADGPAQAKVSVNGDTFSFSGGTCTEAGGVLSLSIGVPPSQAQAGPHPDYFGAYIPDAPGTFADGAISITKAGKDYDLGAATGVATKNGATFSGTPMMQPATHVQGMFRC